MKTRKTKLFGLALVSLALIAATCNRGAQSTPTLGYKHLYEAVKKKDSEGIKNSLSKGTIALMRNYAELQKKPFEKVIENGLTETTFAPQLPEMRNEKITGNLAILEVKNEKTGVWEALPFAKEDGQWKLAIDTYFNGTMSPKGPTNPEHPGELPPGTKPGPPQNTAPGGKRLPQPGEPLPDTAPPQPGAAQPAPTSGAKPEAPKKDIKPPTKD